MIYFCLIGLIGSLLMLLGDQLLYLSKLSVKKEKTVDAMDYIALAAFFLNCFGIVWKI